MTSEAGKQIITISILPNISRSKNNQIMKFGKLIENEMRNIFLAISYTKCGGVTLPRPFFFKKKTIIEHISESIV